MTAGLSKASLVRAAASLMVCKLGDAGTSVLCPMTRDDVKGTVRAAVDRSQLGSHSLLSSSLGSRH